MIEYIMLVITLSVFPITWIVYGRFYDEGLFGKHACNWINSHCLSFGKHYVDKRWLCDNHYSQYESRRKIVFGN